MSPPSSPDNPASEEIVELVFELTDASHFSVRLSADQSCLVRLDRSIRRATGRVDGFLTARGATADALDEQAAHGSSADRVRVVYERDSELMFQIIDMDCRLEQTLEAAGAVPQTVLARDGTARASALVPQPTATRDVAEHVFDRYPAAELVRRRSRDLPAPVATREALELLVRDRLTDRQWEVLRAAHRSGYWNRPRERTGEELAEELGITSATFSQHVRAAYRNVFDALFDRDTWPDDR